MMSLNYLFGVTIGTRFSTISIDVSSFRGGETFRLSRAWGSSCSSSSHWIRNIRISIAPWLPPNPIVEWMRLPSPGGIPPFQLPKASYQLPTTACSLGLWHCWFLLRINLVIGALSSLILQKCVNSVCVCEWGQCFNMFQQTTWKPKPT